VNLPLFIAWRYLFAKKSHNIINVISFISAAGLAIGTAALILILSVYNGFNCVVEENLSSSDPDILIVRPDRSVFEPEDSPQLREIISDSRVAMSSGVLEFGVYFKYDKNESVGYIRGVDEFPGVRLRLGDIPQAISGMGLASRLDIRPSRTVPLKIYYPDRDSNISLIDPSSSLREAEVYPGELVNFGAEQDDKMAVVPIETARKLFSAPEGAVNGLSLYLKDNSKPAVESFRKSFHPDGFLLLDSHRQHPDLFRMMSLEKAAVFLILVLIVLIVSFNIFGSLSMLIIEKEEDVRTLRSLGAGNELIRRIFLLEGSLVSLLGMLEGLVIGVGLALAQQYLGIIKMPGNFLVDSYPVVLKWTDVVVSAFSVASIGVLIALLPSRKAVA